MEKTYYDFVNEITPAELYEGLLGYGLFSEKLPPVFTSVPFYEYCTKVKDSFPKSSPTDFIYYESIRNINMPRPLGIPNPVSYHLLCKCLKENWPQLQEYFKTVTENQSHIISRTHIRKQQDTKALFSMNYKDWRADGTPELELLIGAKYIVRADISNCFPSIYSHSMSWALVGKDVAKQNQKEKSIWYNIIDYRTTYIKNGETHGLLIGPHVSNILSEIILSKIDFNLCEKKYHYTRCIDDYTCYVETYEEGQKFLIDLAEQLRYYDLILNRKKTSIDELPTAAIEQWVRRINSLSFFTDNKLMDFNDIRAYLDSVIELMLDNKGNAAVLNYAIKVLSKKQKTNNANNYYQKTIFHLALLYPYLIPLIDEYVIKLCSTPVSEIREIANRIFLANLAAKNYEGVSYAIYYAIKYDFAIDNLCFDDAKNSNSCIFLLFTYLYYKKNKVKSKIAECKSFAKELLAHNMDNYWLYVYETLPASELNTYWKNMKRNGVSFIINI